MNQRTVRTPGRGTGKRERAVGKTVILVTAKQQTGNALQRRSGLTIFRWAASVFDFETGCFSTLCHAAASFLARYFEEEYQVDADVTIRALCNKTECRFGTWYSPVQTQNALRQAYSESCVGRFLQALLRNRSHNAMAQYSAVVVAGPDFHLLRPVPPQEVQWAMQHQRDVYTSGQLDSGGYTDGFYIGAPATVAHVLQRFWHFGQDLPTEWDYEHLVKVAFERHGLRRIISTVKFEKVRADVCVMWCRNPPRFRAACRRPPYMPEVVVRNKVRAMPGW